PRRRRAFQRAQRILHEGNWQQALTIINEAQAIGTLSSLWEGQLRNTEGECRRAAGEAALAESQFEDALEHHLAASRLLNLPEAAARQRVIDAMLAEIRRRFAASQGPETRSILEMIERLLRIESRNSEAAFWRGLCQVRQSRHDEAIESL